MRDSLTHNKLIRPAVTSVEITMATQTIQDQYVQVGNIKTRYWAMGDHGANVVMVHGLGGYIENWALNIAALGQHYRAYAVDLVGFGRTDKPDIAYSVSALARFLRDFMETQGMDRASLIGNSMGGGVALQFALTYPDMVDRLVLVDSAGLGKEVTITLRLASTPLLGDLLTRPNRKGVEQLFREIIYDPAQITEEMIDLQYEMSALPGAQKSFLKTLRSMGTFFGVRSQFIDPILEGLPKISAPTLVVWGQQDKVLPVSQAHVAAEIIPNAQLHIFDPCGHVPQIERPEEFNKLVLEFLS